MAKARLHYRYFDTCHVVIMIICVWGVRVSVCICVNILCVLIPVTEKNKLKLGLKLMPSVFCDLQSSEHKYL